MPTKEDHYEKGMEAMASGNLSGAIRELRSAVALDSKYADALQALAMIHYQSGDLESAIEAGKQLVQINPEDILAHTSLSMFYVAKGMVPEAEAEAAEARRLTWKEQLKAPKKKS